MPGWDGTLTFDRDSNTVMIKDAPYGLTKHIDKEARYYIYGVDFQHVAEIPSQISQALFHCKLMGKVRRGWFFGKQSVYCETRAKLDETSSKSLAKMLLSIDGAREICDESQNMFRTCK